MYAHKVQRKLDALTPTQREGYQLLARIATEYSLSFRDAPTVTDALYQEAEQAYGLSFGEAPDIIDPLNQETAEE
jgi:hypothetical protein